MPPSPRPPGLPEVTATRGGRGHLMADILVERVTGQACADGVPVEIQLVMPAETLLGEGEEPALVAGHGAVPAAFARDLLARCGKEEAPTWLRRLFSTPDARDLVSPREPAAALRRSTAGAHRAPRPDLPHSVVRCPGPPRRPHRPRPGWWRHVGRERAGALRGLQPRQGGTRLACHDAGPGAVAGRSAGAAPHSANHHSDGACLRLHGPSAPAHPPGRQAQHSRAPHPAPAGGRLAALLARDERGGEGSHAPAARKGVDPHAASGATVVP